MPLQVTQGNVRINGSPTRSGTPLSESDSSFVSAQSENTSNQQPHIDQSAPVLTSHRLRDAHDTSNSSSSSPSAFQDLTPLASRHVLSSTGFKSTFTDVSSPAESYFDSPPSPSASSKPRSPESKRPPASRSSHGIETRSGPPPALSTRRSINVDTPWRSPPSTNPGLYQTGADGNTNSDVNDTHCVLNARPEQTDYGLEVMMTRSENEAPRERASAPVDDDQDSTLRVKTQYRTDHQGDGRPRPQQEDLFLNLSRTDPLADDGSDSMSRAERRRVSAPSCQHFPAMSYDALLQRCYAQLKERDAWRGL